MLGMGKLETKANMIVLVDTIRLLEGTHMIVTTNAAIAGKQITAYHGIASGNITYSRSFDKGIKA